MKSKRVIFGLNTVRKKVLILSKLIGGVMILFYLLTIELPDSSITSFLLLFIVMGVVVTGCDFLLGRLISRPLTKINQTADKMAKLDFTARCDIHTNDEFGELSNSLNVMSDNLQRALKELEIANSQLEKDVEQKKHLLAQRKELVDTLSHEMKTPLGLIRAYTEGLQDEVDASKRTQYMDSILSATARMNSMIISLLDLSALEAGAAKLSEERFDFIELVETIAGRLLIDAPAAEFSFTYHLPEHRVFVNADKQRMEQVLSNLIENAKQHVCAGGEIKLAVDCQHQKLRFLIYNQGTWIPGQELSKVWLKFYKGQDSKKNSSGLGLAIVAQILSMYHAPYSVENRQAGVEFSFYFPVIL